MRDSVRIRFGIGETGWAKTLGNNRYRINNIPCMEDLNIDDLVYCEEVDGWLEIIDVLERKYDLKTMVYYNSKDQFVALKEKMVNADVKMEGMIGPHEGKPGICFIAHVKGYDVESIMKELGIERFETIEVL